MRYFIRFEITYRNGSKKIKTRLVNIKTREEAFQVIKDQQFQDYSVEDVKFLEVVKM
jgi:hypothetical protein